MKLSCPVFDVKVAFFSCDPLEKGRNQGPCLAWDLAWMRQIHEELDWWHLMVGFVGQIGRAKGWAEAAYVAQIAELFLEVDDTDSKVMFEGKLSWSCCFSS